MVGEQKKGIFLRSPQKVGNRIHFRLPHKCKILSFNNEVLLSLFLRQFLDVGEHPHGGKDNPSVRKVYRHFAPIRGKIHFFHLDGYALQLMFFHNSLLFATNIANLYHLHNIFPNFFSHLSQKFGNSKTRPYLYTRNN